MGLERILESLGKPSKIDNSDCRPREACLRRQGGDPV
jgi:hypothetical protein